MDTTPGDVLDQLATDRRGKSVEFLGFGTSAYDACLYYDYRLGSSNWTRAPRAGGGNHG